jgi:hypothetical protein
MLSPLETAENIIATYTSQSLEVSLPRLHLSFFVNTNGELECRSMPNYVVDKSQSCGTMFGLRNKLLLCPRPNSSDQSLLPRRVIIPQGKVSFCTMGDFTSISINTDAEQHVRWHEYTIDTDLGRLTSNTSLRSKLYQCYLHALTSHCLPDPLLGHTGTEEALYMLRSAACRSFQRLDGHEAKLLELIGELTPKRVYYPTNLRSMATVKWNDLPALSQHHDYFGAVCTILDHARVLETLYDQPTTFDSRDRDQLLLNRAASRNKVYYPSDLQISEQPSSFDDVGYKSRDVPDRETAGHVAYQASWSIWNAQPSLDRKLLQPKLWDLMRSWGSVGPASGEVSLRYSRYWLEFDAARDWFAVYNLCRHAVNGGLPSMRIKLSFCLSAAAYSKSKYSDIIPLFIVFALDERCRYLSPPPDLSYTLSDGVAPALANLENLVSRSALSIEWIPAQLFKVEATGSKKVRRRRRKEEYNAVIQRESSLAAKSILPQWPDHRSVDLPKMWFDKSECHRYIEGYIQSISRNIQLKDYVLQLQNILQQYGNLSVPTSTRYEFSSRFTTSHSKAPSYSIRDVLSSRNNVPIPLAEQPLLEDRISPTTADTLEPVDSDGLGILIEELQHSWQPLLELYGNELDRSYRELMGHSASQSAQGDVPSHELLHLYHDECSHRKYKIFSEISATLAPSQHVEKANAIAGLWPRITPRSLLSQLAQDRIGTLPDQWKAVITHYAVCLLKFQQSQRLLELSSSQKREELLREIDTMRSDVLAESTPDWLLVQVRPLRFRRSRLRWPLGTDRGKFHGSSGSGSCRTQNDFSKLQPEHIPSTQYGRGQVVSYCASRCFDSRGWLKPHESRDTQTSIEPDVPTTRYPTVWTT